MSNFPYAVPDDIDEVIAFMAALGATNTWTNSIYPYTEYHPSLIAWMQFGDPSFGITNPGDAIATWRFKAEDQQKSRNLQQWESSLINMVPNHGMYGTDLASAHFSFLLLDRTAAVLTAAGFPRASVAATTALYQHAARRARYRFSAPTVDDLYACARIANHTNLTGRQRLAWVWRQLPEAEITTMLANGMPFSLIKDLFPDEERSR